MPKISVITINYGHSKKIKSLWKSLETRSPKKDFEFIVVDNASPGEDGQALRAFFRAQKKGHVILLNKNLGFGGGYREGVKFASGKYIGIVNPDIELQENCFERLLEVLEQDKRIGITVPLLENPDGSLQQNVRKFPSFWTLLGRRLFSRFRQLYDIDPHWYDTEEPVSVDWAQGSFLFMEKEFFQNTLGGFDPRFFLFMEDTDLCRRTWMVGKRVVLVPKARAIHGTERLSGHDFWHAVWKKTFWIHLSSAFKYFFKYLFKPKPKIF